MRLSPLQRIKPGQIFPARGTVNDILQQLNSLGAGGGAGLRNMPQGLTTPPENPTWIYTEITDNEDPTDSGLHGHQQIQFQQLEDGEWVSSTIGVVGEIDSNPLKELNGRAIPVGEVVRAELGPGDRCWVTVWWGDESFGSGSGAGRSGTITCTDGSTYSYRISNGNIIVADD